MKKLIISLFLLFFTFTNAQSIKFEGMVKDTTGVALDMANVMAINQVTKAMDGYSITNEKGKFSIALQPNSLYEIKASYVGFQTKSLKIQTTDQNIIKNITLFEGTQLKGVEVVHEMPVSISGDTIVYNSDSFTNGTEKKLEDVLKKLPGVEVNKDGEIEVEGKKVQKVMVEGKDFFDGDSKIATKNIPADAIDKVQVLRNYNEVSNLKGLENNEENLALNIKLKEGKKNFWFGDVTAGAGGHEKIDRYITNPKLFYYNPKYSLNVISNLNNIGELPLTMQDYFKFTGGFKNMMKKGGSSFNVSSNELGIMGLRNDKAKEINTKFGAANFSYNPTKALSISGFGIFLSNRTELETKSFNQRTDNLNGNQTTISENKNDLSKQASDLGMFKLSSSYIPSEKVHLDYDALIKLSNQNEKTSIFSDVLDDIYTEKAQKPFSINQNLNYYYTLNDKNIFSFEGQHLYQTEDPFYTANLENQPFNLAGYISQTLINQRDIISQNRMTTTNKTDAKIDYYYVVTPKSNINITLGNTYSYQKFNSSMFQTLGNGAINPLNATENINAVTYKFNDVFLGLHYKILAGKFTFNPGFSVHQYQMTNSQNQLDYKQTFNRVLPDLYALYQIKKSETLTYNFSFTNDFTDINRIAKGYVFSNYNSLFSGNPSLENATAQTHSLRYFRYNMFNFENIFANINYSKRVDAVKSKVFFNGLNQQSTATNMDSNFADETFFANANYGRSFSKYYKASAGININWSKFNNYRLFSGQERIEKTESFSQTYQAKFATNFKKVPNVEIGYSYTKNDFFNDVFYIDAPSASVSYYFLDGFSFVSDYTYYHNKNKAKTIQNEYDFLSAELSYRKKDSKWEYKLSGTNLLNTKSLNDSSFSQLGGSSSFSSYIVQPRFIMATLKYNL